MTYIKCLEGNKREYMEKRNFTVKKKGGMSRKLSIRQNSCWDLKEKK